MIKEAQIELLMLAAKQGVCRTYCCTYVQYGIFLPPPKSPKQQVFHIEEPDPEKQKVLLEGNALEYGIVWFDTQRVMFKWHDGRMALTPDYVGSEVWKEFLNLDSSTAFVGEQ